MGLKIPVTFFSNLYTLLFHFYHIYEIIFIAKKVYTVNTQIRLTCDKHKRDWKYMAGNVHKHETSTINVLGIETFALEYLIQCCGSTSKERT